MRLDSPTVAKLKLQPGEKDKIYFDDALIGFGIRLRGVGRRLRRRWIVQYRQDGHTRRLKIGDADVMDAKEARKRALAALAAIAKGEDPQADKAKARRDAALTLRSVAAGYLEMKELEMQRGEYRASSLRVTRLYLTGKQYFGPLHAMGVSKIGLADVAACLNVIERKSGSATAGRARSALSTAFVWAMQQGFMGSHPQNPVIATKKPNDATPRDRVLEDDELAAIWRACEDDHFGRIVKLLMLTGCRREEIGGLRWNEIDLEAGTITLPKERVKNKHEHTLPLTPMAMEIIRAIPERVSRDHLFGERAKAGFTHWYEAKNELDDRLSDVGEWRLHDLRRTVATRMADLGTQPHVIESILNHRSGHRAGVAGIYNRSSYEREVRAALALWTDHIRAIVAGGKRKIISFPQAG
jgi:integrase